MSRVIFVFSKTHLHFDYITRIWFFQYLFGFWGKYKKSKNPKFKVILHGLVYLIPILRCNYYRLIVEGYSISSGFVGIDKTTPQTADLR